MKINKRTIDGDTYSEFKYWSGSKTEYCCSFDANGLFYLKVYGIKFNRILYKMLCINKPYRIKVGKVWKKS
jgi:hypothetical protein